MDIINNTKSKLKIISKLLAVSCKLLGKKLSTKSYNPKTIGSLLQPTTYNLQPSQGFTLIETLVAISILMIAVASPLTIAQKGLSSAIYAKDQVTASYLAQDAIEYIINWSGQNVEQNNALVGWLDVINTECSTSCGVDTFINYPNLLGIQACSTKGINGCTLNYDSSLNRYDYRVGVAASPFTRSVTVTEIAPGADEAEIKVNISWTSKNGPRSLDFYTRIFNWH